MTVGETIAALGERFAAQDLFYGHGTDNALDEAYYLVFAALELDFSDTDLELQRPLPQDDQERIERLAHRRIRERLPVAYLVGEAWFAGLPFHVDHRVLVPRSPMAELITAGFGGLLTRPPYRILDLCTGSGCIGIACAQQFPGSRVDLADIDAGALAVAQRNVERHDVGDRVRILQSDLFDAVDGVYDLVITNPPYVSDDEVSGLPREYHHEPVLGLRSDDGGMALPLRILDQTAGYLAPGGLLVMEVGYSWPELERRCPRHPFLWLSFEGGGEGVLALTREQLSTV
ncbi:MAG: 50S ribosomal protein L3 N(5)-glutamine methyltransferase [Pseudohongiellaceae bacterium]